MTHQRRRLVSVAVGLVLAAGATSIALGAVQVVELSAERVVPGTVVTLRVATTSSVVATEPGRLFMIPIGTWGDSPDSLRCEEVHGAIEVGQIHWQAGAVEYQGTTYDGFEGESSFTVPSVDPYTYWLAEAIDTVGTRCHAFTLFEVVAELPNTALPLVSPTSLAGLGGFLAVALAGFLLFGWRLTRGGLGRT